MSETWRLCALAGGSEACVPLLGVGWRGGSEAHPPLENFEI